MSEKKEIKGRYPIIGNGARDITVIDNRNGGGEFSLLPVSQCLNYLTASTTNVSTSVNSTGTGTDSCDIPSLTKDSGHSLTDQMGKLTINPTSITSPSNGSTNEKNEYILLDSGNPEAWSRVIDAVDDRNGIVIGVILTHFDQDHSGGFKKIYELANRPCKDDEDDDVFKCKRFMENIHFIVAPSIPFTFQNSVDFKKLISKWYHDSCNDYFGTFEESIKLSAKEISEFVFKKSKGSVLVRKTYSDTNYAIFIEKVKQEITGKKKQKNGDIIQNNFTGTQPNLMALWRRTNIPKDEVLREYNHPEEPSYEETPILRSSLLKSTRTSKHTIDSSTANRSSLLVCYIGENESGENVFYSFNGDTVLSEAAHDHKWFPKNHDMYQQLINSTDNSLPDKRDEELYLQKLYTLLFDTEHMSEPVKDIYSTSQKWDMFQLPHHGSAASFDTDQMKNQLKGLAHNYFIISPGTMYHCSSLVYKALADTLEESTNNNGSDKKGSTGKDSNSNSEESKSNGKDSNVNSEESKCNSKESNSNNENSSAFKSIYIGCAPSSKYLTYAFDQDQTILNDIYSNYYRLVNACFNKNCRFTVMFDHTNHTYELIHPVEKRSDYDFVDKEQKKKDHGMSNSNSN